MAAMALTAFGAMAQIEPKTVRGVVVDNNGNPIAGAEVTATGGGSSAITDSDGSFSLQVSPYLKTLTATYAGMGSKKQKVKFDKDMVFRMKEAWKTRGFISLIGNIGFNNYWQWGDYSTVYEDDNKKIRECVDGEDASIFGGGGLMGGVLGKWGAYGKFVYSSNKDITATAGFIKGCSRVFYIYFGIGYGSLRFPNNKEHIDQDYFTYNSGYWKYESSSCKTKTIERKFHGFACDLGFIIKPSKHFFFSIGPSLTTNFDDATKYRVDVGVGYVF